MFKIALWIMVLLFAGLAIACGFWSYQAYQGGGCAVTHSSMTLPPMAVLFAVAGGLAMFWAFMFGSMARDPNYK